MGSAAELSPQAVVVGGGIAGLLAAAAACKRFGRVVLLEQDELGGRVEEESVEEASTVAGESVLVVGLRPGYTKHLPEREALQAAHPPLLPPSRAAPPVLRQCSASD